VTTNIKGKMKGGEFCRCLVFARILTLVQVPAHGDGEDQAAVVRVGSADHGPHHQLDSTVKHCTAGTTWKLARACINRGTNA